MSNLYRRKNHMPAGRAGRRSKRLWRQMEKFYESRGNMVKPFIEAGLVIESIPCEPGDESNWFNQLQSALEPGLTEICRRAMEEESKLAYGIRENEIVSRGGKL